MKLMPKIQILIFTLGCLMISNVFAERDIINMPNNATTGLWASNRSRQIQNTIVWGAKRTPGHNMTQSTHRLLECKVKACVDILIRQLNEVNAKLRIDFDTNYELGLNRVIIDGKNHYDERRKIWNNAFHAEKDRLIQLRTELPDHPLSDLDKRKIEYYAAFFGDQYISHITYLPGKST